jgi:hypothetical protein
MTLNNFVNVALVAVIIFFAASIGFVLHRIDALDARR